MQVCLLSRYRLSKCIPKITHACCALQSAVERAFSCNSLRCRSLWIIHKTYDRFIPLPHMKFLWLFGGSEVCLPDSATVTQLCRRYHQYAHCVCRCPDACQPFHTLPAACWCCSVHITPILRSLHWLKINERIEYKLLSLTYKVLTTSQPDYLHNLISVDWTEIRLCR